MKPGFSLVEIIIVLLIIGIMAVVGLPALRTKRVTPQDFTSKLNVLMQAAWQQALLEGHVQKVYFDFTNKRITLSELSERGKDKDSDKFVPLKQAYFDTELLIPAGYSFNNFFIEKEDEMRRGERKDAWFFLTPAGLTQEVIINITDRGEQEATQEVERFSLVLSPFSAQFEYYGTFQRP